VTELLMIGRPSGRVAFVGAGPGDPGLMTVRSRELLAAADAVVVDTAGREPLVAAYAKPGVVVVDVRHSEDGEELTVAARAKLLVSTAVQVPRGLVVRLMDGDPALFHGFPDEAMALRRSGVAFEVVPGVSSVTAVPTYAGVPLTCRKATRVLVVHAGVPGQDWSCATADDTTVVVLGSAPRIVEALARLVEVGRSEQTPAMVVEAGTTTEQVSRVTTLGDAGEFVESARVGAPVMVILGRPVGLRDALSWFETKPLFGWRVLLPRTKDPLDEALTRIGDFGGRPTIVPTIGVEPPRTPAQMERAVKGLVTGRYAWVGFTSGNAVRAVREYVDGFGLDVRCFAGVQIAATGADTVRALREWGLIPDLVPTAEHSTAALLSVWPDFDDDEDALGRVFLPRADISTDTLVAGLADLGWEVDDVTAYRTVRAAPPAASIREEIKAGSFDAAVFTSSATVRNLVGIAGKPHPQTVIACIGPATARTAEELGLRVDVLAPEPTAEAVIEALAGHATRLALVAREAGMPVRRPSERRPARRRAR